MNVVAAEEQPLEEQLHLLEESDLRYVFDGQIQLQLLLDRQWLRELWLLWFMEANLVGTLLYQHTIDGALGDLVLLGDLFNGDTEVAVLEGDGLLLQVAYASDGHGISFWTGVAAVRFKRHIYL
jgi:hypothetical protein